MKNYLAITFAAIAWFAVVTQYFLMIDNRVVSIHETTLRFFSFFTILTNTLVAIYFSAYLLRKNHGILSLAKKPGTLTAIAVYIIIVGLVYQIILRPIWEPEGLQMIVDELLHSVIPIAVAVYWYLYEDKRAVSYRQIPKWLIYPFIYLILILLLGASSGFYPYPFVDVAHIGFNQVLINSTGLIILFISLSVLMVKLGRILGNRT